MTLESGFRVELPPDKSFRFCDLRAYESPLKGWSVSEMDFGYWDEDREAICLLELKDLSFRRPKSPMGHPNHPTTDPKAEIEKLKDQIKGNIKDVLVMMHAAWNQLGHGKTLAQELPERFRAPARIMMYFVLKLPESARASGPPQSYKDVADSTARGYAMLLGLDVRAVVFDQWTALGHKLPISLVD